MPRKDMSQKQRGKEKFDKMPVSRMERPEVEEQKPEWLKIQLPKAEKVNQVKDMLRSERLVTVCEEASCPNIAECFSSGSATFMIMGDKCTRRCGFCDVAHGRPDALDPLEPARVADAAKKMGLRHVVITSVDRDDLPDGGASHFVACVKAIRHQLPNATVEILVPDFRGRMEKALETLAEAPADVFNHNLETVGRLYKVARAGSDYHWSLKLLYEHKRRFPHIPTKSGIMLGLGETDDEVQQVIRDLRAYEVDMLTMGQYLQPSEYHMPVERYVTPEKFMELGDYAKSLGFSNVASGPLVRSSYHADQQAVSAGVE